MISFKNKNNCKYAIKAKFQENKSPTNQIKILNISLRNNTTQIN